MSGQYVTQQLDRVREAARDMCQRLAPIMADVG